MAYTIGSGMDPNPNNSHESLNMPSLGSVGVCSPGPFTAHHIKLVQTSDIPAGDAAA